MKSISFKNFRRFTDFPEFKFGDITILVGGNNAGKSTLVKALLLVLDNLKTMRREINFGETDNIFRVLSNPEFRFDENTFHELNIKNFSRALNRHCDKDEAITFNLTVEHPLTQELYEFKIVVSRCGTDYNKGTEDDSRGQIDFISISNLTKEIRLEFSFASVKEAPYMYVIIPDENARKLAEQIESLQKQKSELEEYIKNWEARYKELNDDSLFMGEVGKLNDRKSELKKIEKVLKEVLIKQKEAKNIEAKLPLANTLNQTTPFLLIDLINDIISYGHHGSSEKKGSKAYNQEMKIKYLLKAQSNILDELAKDIRILLQGFNVDYIQAHGVTQRTLFSSSDSSDHIAVTIKDFMQSRAGRNNEIRAFIQHWMRKLNIGYDYAVNDIDGEAFKVFIFESAEDKTGFPLADLGMGSIQLMMLLFALASSIKRNFGDVFDKPTVIIEEPEQNLHPAIQSCLSEILFDVNEKFGIKFIVETHSEYLIRRSQVLVAEMGLTDAELEKQNPFKVYYFPSEGFPYDMCYRNDGRFAEEFGTGFFNEASNLAISLF